MTSTSTRDLFRQSLAEAATRAKLSLPECSSRIDLAVTLVLRGDVDLQADGTALVGSQSTPTQKHLVNGMCDCRDFPQAPGGWCKHRTARALQLRTDRAMRTHLDAEASTTPQVTSGAAQLPTPTPEDDDPAWYLRAPSLDDIGAVGAIPPRPPRTVDAEKGRGASAPPPRRLESRTHPRPCQTP